jgi:hypothetical protein
MYRRWKQSDQPKEEQAPARVIANEAVLKQGQTGRESLM